MFSITNSWGSPQQLGAILTSCLNANVPVPSGPLSLRNGLLIFGIVCLVTLLIFLHSLHLSALLNVSTSLISSTLHRFLSAGIVSSTFVLLMFLFYLIFFIFIFLGRLLSPVLYFSLVAPAICYLFFLHVVLYVFLANKWWCHNLVNLIIARTSHIGYNGRGRWRRNTYRYILKIMKVCRNSS